MPKHPLIPGPCHSHPKAQVPWGRSRISRGAFPFPHHQCLRKPLWLPRPIQLPRHHSKAHEKLSPGFLFHMQCLEPSGPHPEGPSTRAGLLQTWWKEAEKDFYLSNTQSSPRSSVWVCPSCAQPSARGEPAFLEQPFSQGNAELMIAGLWEGGLFSWRLFRVRELGPGAGSAGALGDCQHSTKTACASSAKCSQSSQEHPNWPQLMKPTVYRLHFYVRAVPTKCQKRAQGKA